MSQKEHNLDDKEKSVNTGDQDKHEKFLIVTPEKTKIKEPKTTQKSNSKFISFVIDAPPLDLRQKSAGKYTGCNCRKSQCLKMYCVCFSSGKMCDQSCLCDSCYNKTDNVLRSQAINEIITKDPFAFSKNQNPKQQKLGDGCNCKRSKCSKKYCECFSKGKECGKSCNCVQCENIKKSYAFEGKLQGLPKKRVKIQ